MYLYIYHFLTIQTYISLCFISYILQNVRLFLQFSNINTFFEDTHVSFYFLIFHIFSEMYDFFTYSPPCKSFLNIQITYFYFLHLIYSPKFAFLNSPLCIFLFLNSSHILINVRRLKRFH